MGGEGAAVPPKSLEGKSGYRGQPGISSVYTLTFGRYPSPGLAVEGDDVETCVPACGGDRMEAGSASSHVVALCMDVRPSLKE